jgi:hypothetical protein
LLERKGEVLKKSDVKVIRGIIKEKGITNYDIFYTYFLNFNEKGKEPRNVHIKLVGLENEEEFRNLLEGKGYVIYDSRELQGGI